MASIVGVFHAVFGEASGLVASLPGLLASTTLKVAVPTVAPPTRFAAILAQKAHAFGIDVALCIVTALENLVTAGTGVSTVLLLDRFSPGALCFDQDAC